MHFIIRPLIILFWAVLIFAALYLPHLPIFTDKKSLTIFSWGDILEPEIIADFEKKTGIKVHLNYYSSNEELLVKLKATRAKGYDLIIPSDYAVSQLIKEELLKPIDRSKIDFFQNLNPALLGHFFDPGNRYSLPLEWELFGFGIDRDFFSNRHLSPSWQWIFEPPENYKIAMINDPLEAVAMTSLYLWKNTSELSKENLQEIETILNKQKRWVEAYADFRADYFLATKNCPLVVASSSYIWRTKRLFPFVEFVQPKEGTFITIENFCIPIHSEKEDLAYQFMNEIYRPASMAKHYETFGFFPATLDVAPLLELTPAERQLIFSTKKDFGKTYFFTKQASTQDVRDLWVEVKSF